MTREEQDMENLGGYFLREFGGAALQGARQGALEQLQNAFAEGYDAAPRESP